MKFSIFVTSHIRMELMKSSYEDKYLIFKNFFFKFLKKNYNFFLLPKDQNNSRLPLHLFNHELECHEEKCASNL
jgi:hypothetical protein